MYVERRVRALWIAIACGILTGSGALRPIPVFAAVDSPGPPAASAAFQSAAQPARGAVAANGSLAGAVMGGTTRTPLPRARVILTSPALGEPRVAITGADGQYAFQHLPPGSYAVAASCSGYASQQYGERRSAAPAPIALAADQRLSGIDLVLAPAGVIAGQILDEDQQPFAGATVEALVARTEQGRPSLAAVATTASDDLGNFRLIGLPAGEYYVSAADPAFAHAGDETGPLRYSPTYYPGATSVDDASRVTVTPGGAPPPRVVIRLKIVRPARISGTLTAPGNAPLMSGSVLLRALHGEFFTVAPPADVSMLPDGTFAFRNVPPGRYQILARAEVPRETSLFATFRVVVEGIDLDNVVIPLLPGAMASGKVETEGARSRKLSLAGARVRAPLADGSMFGDALTGDVRPDGSYTIRGLMPGTHTFTIEGLPAPWLVKSVSYRDQDISDAGMPVESRAKYQDIRITITDEPTDVSGTVRDARSAPAPDAAVLLIPMAQQFWTPVSRRFGFTRTDESGRYRVRGLPAGEYRVVALIDLDESQAYRRELLQRLSAAGAVLELKPRESRTLDLPLTARTAAGGGPFPLHLKPQ